MVLQNRLGYGFNGYQVPPTPRSTRSARRRGSIGKKVDDNQMRAFDLLATVAGELLEGQLSPSSSNTLTGKEQCAIEKDSIKKEQLDKYNTSKVEPSSLFSGAPGLRYSTKEFSLACNDDCSVLASVITSCDCSEKIGCADKLVNGESKIQPGSSKLETPWTASYSTKPYMSSSDDLAVGYRKPPALISQENRVKVPLGTDRVSFSACRDDVKLVVRDDDENSSGCTQPSTTKKAFRPSPCIGDRRIRKLLASKYWKAAPKLKNGEYFIADLEAKPVYHNRKTFYKRKRSLRDYPFKKRLIYDRRSVSNSHGGITSEGIASSPRKGFSCDASGSGATLHGAFGTPASVASRHTPFQSRDSHVKLRIKSFKVPELFIEIPETATVGSLKRSVLEAVNAILGGGLRVGVLLQGKKIRDDNKTLLQTGLARENKLDALGFSLEPTPLHAPLALCNEDHPLLSCEAPQPLTRYPAVPSVVHNIIEQSAADALPDPRLTSLGNFVESDHDSAPSPPDMSIYKIPMNSRALVTVPEMDAEALAIVPMRKSKRSEAVQRRIRRPFSVSEVEALVHAVEKLGTGRWRDVKLRAFDNAKHRTYVDLKDKWKTLVHTARISPQQRRGEPVPQELLDRVLDAHAYWSQQAAKQQLKQHSETCLIS